MSLLECVHISDANATRKTLALGEDDQEFRMSNVTVPDDLFRFLDFQFALLMALPSRRRSL